MTSRIELDTRPRNAIHLPACYPVIVASTYLDRRKALTEQPPKTEPLPEQVPATAACCWLEFGPPAPDQHVGADGRGLTWAEIQRAKGG